MSKYAKDEMTREPFISMNKLLQQLSFLVFILTKVGIEF